jgi:hypothetical protein
MRRVHPRYAPGRFAGNISLTFIMPTMVMAESPTLVSKCQPIRMVGAANELISPNSKKNTNPS